jgi:hypothetical protein
VKKVKGPAAYELTLQCLDFDEDGEAFCQSDMMSNLAAPCVFLAECVTQLLPFSSI